MKFYLRTLLATMLSVSAAAWAQGGGRAGRGAVAQQAGAELGGAQQAEPPGRGVEFYDYDSTATSVPIVPLAPPAETHQKIAVRGEAFAYTARVGVMPLHNATTGQTAAHIFYTSYTKDGDSDGPRPVVFFLGGAPGVAASWQEFGGLGPKRMRWMNDGSAGTAPYGWVDNPNTLLGQADLVFVNPAGTAFSRPDRPGAGPSFWNTTGDVASMGAFVASFLNTYNRRNSPVFLAGEDFGTARTAGLAAYLIEHQTPVHGVVLLSMAMSADALAGDAQFITLLPTLVMAAWHHKKLAPELNGMTAEQISGQARQFASREYLHALYKGDRMTPEERTKAIADLSRLTGLSKAVIANNDLRISLERFNGELLRDDRRALSNSDARVTGFVPVAAGGRGFGGGRGAIGAAPVPLDFNLSKAAGGFETAYEDYLRHELGYDVTGNGIFYLLGGGVGAFSLTGSDDASLAAAFARNPNLRLFVGMNYFDLNAPFYAAEFTLAHLSVSSEVRAHNITVSHFEAGQMTYVDNKALVGLQAELGRFVNETVSLAGK